MNVKPKFVYYDIRRMNPVNLISYTHENDVDTQVLEISMLNNGEPIELSVDYTYSAAIVNRDTKALINDNISCELNDSGNVLIPIDNFHTLGAQDLLIELTITDSAGNQVLVTPFPLWIHVNASILDDAQVTPESEGTVPELLEDAEKALEDAQQAIEDAGDYENLTHKPQINGHELVGDKTGDDLGLQNKLTAGENVNIDANGNITITGVTKYRKVSMEQVGNCIENGVLYSLYISGLQSTAQIIAHNNYTTITQHALLDDGRLMYRMRQGETPWQPAGRWSAWESIGGSQIVSGVVNQNGSITFTNSDGSTFTTTGSSVIGADGFSPTATVTQTQSGATVSITDKNGTTTANISNGDDYVLTPQDKSDIANIVLSELPTTRGVQYGNTSN